MEKVLANLKNTLEYLPGYNVIYKVDQGLKRICYSSNVPSLTGYTAEEYTQYANDQVLNLVYPPDRKLIHMKMQEQIGRNTDLDISFRLLHKNGSVIWVREHIKYIATIDDCPVYLASFFDVTDEWRNKDILLEVSDRAVAVIDKWNKIVLYGNTKFFAYVGATSEECLGKTCHQVVCKMGDKWLPEHCVCFKALEHHPSLEYYDEAADKHFSIISREIIWGEHQAIVFYLEDITKQKKNAEELERKNKQMQQLQTESLRAYERQLNAIMEINPDALSTCQINITKNICTNGTSKYANLLKLQTGGTVDSYFATAREFVQADEFYETVGRFSRKALLESFAQGRTAVTSEVQYMLEDEDERFIRTIVRMTENPLTHDVEGIIYTLDLTKKTLDDAIMQSVFIKTYDGAAVIDVQREKYFVLQFSYDATISCRTVLCEYTEGLKRLVEGYVAKAEQQEYLHNASLPVIVQELENKATYSFLANYVVGGRARLKKISYHYLDAHKKKIISLAEDITEITQQERKRLEEMRQALHEAEAAREAKTMFFANISHDMRTPLNGVLGFTALGKEVNTLAEKDECLDKIRASGEFLLHLINDTLDMSKIDSNHMTLEYTGIVINEVMHNILASVEQTAKDKHIHLQAQLLPANGEFVGGDKMRIQQIFINLLGNAIKFTPEGGTVELRVEHLPQEIKGCNYKISVRDTGIGMRKEFIPYAFEAFAQQEGVDTQKAMGTGLGLAIVKQLVLLMRGDIELQSEEGKGTNISVYLPLAPAQGQQEATVKQEEPLELKGKKLLLCEDHPINRELVMGLLRKKEIVAECAADGEIGVAMFKQSALNYYDGILMDVRMPHMDGLEATRAIRQLARADAKSIPIIAMTANAFAEDRQKAVEAGMNGYIVKPIIPLELYKNLNSLLRKQ